MRNYKWAVYGEYGGSFTNLKDAKACAKESSTTAENNYCAYVWLIEDGCNYFKYENGKLTRDGWTRPRRTK